jgi:hypothetical protein
VILLSGLAIVTLPNSDDSLTVVAGESAMLFAADTAAVSRQGHGGTFPGTTESIVLQIPTMNGLVPEHKVLYEGTCG